MWLKTTFLFPVFILALLILHQSAFAAECTPPTPPSCITSNPSEPIGSVNDGTIYLPNGEYISNGSLYNPPVAAASSGCSFDVQSNYLLQKQQYQECVAEDGATSDNSPNVSPELQALNAKTQEMTNEFNSISSTTSSPASVVTPSCSYGSNEDGSCITLTQACIANYGSNAISSGSGCDCVADYEFSDSSNSCIAITTPSELPVIPRTTKPTPIPFSSKIVKKSLQSKSVIEQAAELMTKATTSPVNYSVHGSGQQIQAVVPPITKAKSDPYSFISNSITQALKWLSMVFG
jgi:hypothetical protein